MEKESPIESSCYYYLKLIGFGAFPHPPHDRLHCLFLKVKELLHGRVGGHVPEGAKLRLHGGDVQLLLLLFTIITTSILLFPLLLHILIYESLQAKG